MQHLYKNPLFYLNVATVLFIGAILVAVSVGGLRLSPLVKNVLATVGVTTDGGTSNYLTVFAAGTNNKIGDSQIFDNGTSVGIGTASISPDFKLRVLGSGNGRVSVENAGGVGGINVGGVGSAMFTGINLFDNTSPNFDNWGIAHLTSGNLAIGFTRLQDFPALSRWVFHFARNGDIYFDEKGLWTSQIKFITGGFLQYVKPATAADVACDIPWGSGSCPGVTGVCGTGDRIAVSKADDTVSGTEPAVGKCDNDPKSGFNNFCHVTTFFCVK